jgi:hypothetical protein
MNRARGKARPSIACGQVARRSQVRGLLHPGAVREQSVPVCNFWQPDCAKSVRSSWYSTSEIMGRGPPRSEHKQQMVHPTPWHPSGLMVCSVNDYRRPRRRGNQEHLQEKKGGCCFLCRRNSTHLADLTPREGACRRGGVTGRRRSQALVQQRRSEPEILQSQMALSAPSNAISGIVQLAHPETHLDFVRHSHLRHPRGKG